MQFLKLDYPDNETAYVNVDTITTIDNLDNGTNWTLSTMDSRILYLYDTPVKTVIDTINALENSDKDYLSVTIIKNGK